MPVDQIQYSERYNDDVYEYRCDISVNVFSGSFLTARLYEDTYSIGNYSKFQRSEEHVILPPDIARLVPKSHLMTETEWRNLGVQQSPGWLHFMVHNPEPHVLLFRRPRTNPTPTNAITSNTTSSVRV